MEKLTFAVSHGACNAHLHIIDPRFPNDGKASSQIGTAAMYRDVAAELGLTRAVFVQAKPFACCNDCIEDGIRVFGKENAVGIGVVKNSVSDAELERLNAAGFRGLRFSVWNPNNAVVSFDDCLPLSERVKDMGWNMQLHMSSKQLLGWADIIRKIKSKIVIDHMGRLDPALGINDPAYKFMQELIEAGHTWIKLSGPYLNTRTGHPYDDASAVAAAIGSFAPERVVWGSDWPHTTEKIKPDEGFLTNLLLKWLPTDKARQLALVNNPEELYGFGK